MKQFKGIIEVHGDNFHGPRDWMEDNGIEIIKRLANGNDPAMNLLVKMFKPKTNDAIERLAEVYLSLDYQAWKMYLRSKVLISRN